MIRLACLYSLYNSSSELIDTLKNLGVPSERLNVINKMSYYTSMNKCPTSPSAISSIGKFAQSIFTMKSSFIENLLTKLGQSFPINEYSLVYGNPHSGQINDLVLFIVGGMTFEEIRLVEEWNKKSCNPRIVLSSNQVLNSKSFIKQVDSIVL